MGNSLRDALRQSGVLATIKPAGKDNERARERQGKSRNRGRGAVPRTDARPKPGAGGDDIDLAAAYAIRARTEHREREEKQRIERETAARRRQQREQLSALLAEHTLNRDEAELPRHFEYGGKIRRVYVTQEQLQPLNDGRYGVVQLRGRYLLVERSMAEAAARIDENALALLVDPDATGPDPDA